MSSRSVPGLFWLVRGARWAIAVTLLTPFGCGTSDDTSGPLLDGVPAQLVFSTPDTVRAGARFTVAVDIRDLQDRIVTDATDTISVAFGANPHGAALFGPTQTVAVGGRAVFDELRISKPGGGYSLIATSGILNRATSDPIAAVLRFASVTAGATHTCGLTVPGIVFCWGDNRSGQLGVSRASGTEDVPRILAGGLTFLYVSAGGAHTCGVATSGEAWCWGNNTSGQLGTGGRGLDKPEPSTVLGPRFASVSAGGLHSCGVALDEGTYCWGDNGWGQLGVGSGVTQSSVPVPLSPDVPFTALTTARFHTCSITPDGTGYCWGRNSSGQLGVGSAMESSATPLAVAGGLVLTSVTAVAEHTCGVTADGAAYCWGENDAGQLGNNNPGVSTATPTRVLHDAPFAQVSAGFRHTCGIDANGLAWCWGGNSSGQLGDGNDGTAAALPVPVVGGIRFAGVSAGFLHTCGVTPDGLLYCWGRNSEGQLGNQSRSVDSDRPVLVIGTPLTLP